MQKKRNEMKLYHTGSVLPSHCPRENHQCNSLTLSALRLLKSSSTNLLMRDCYPVGLFKPSSAPSHAEQVLVVIKLAVKFSPSTKVFFPSYSIRHHVLLLNRPETGPTVQRLELHLQLPIVSPKVVV